MRGCLCDIGSRIVCLDGDLCDLGENGDLSGANFPGKFARCTIILESKNKIPCALQRGISMPMCHHKWYSLIGCEFE